MDEFITHTWRGKEENILTRTERALAFLDTWSVDDEIVQLRLKYTVRYRPVFSTNHPLDHTRGVVRTLMHRVDTIDLVSDERDKVEENAKHVTCKNVNM